MKLTRIASVFLVAAVVLVLLGTTAYTKEKPDKPEPGERPHRLQRGPLPNHFPMLNNEAFKEEMERHREAVAKIMEKTEDLREELHEQIKELREEHFPKPEEGKRHKRPDREKIREFMEEMKELVDEFAEDNERKLKRIAGKLFDEKIEHMEKVIKIMKKNRKELIEAHYKKILVHPLRARIRAVFQRRMGPRPRDDRRPDWRGEKPNRKPARFEEEDDDDE